MSRLIFTSENAKLSNTLIFSLPAGYSCPAARICLSKADRITGKITDGKNCEVRCFGASCEARSPQLRKNVWHNLDLLNKAIRKGATAVADLIDASMPDWNGLIRIHSTGGDFFHPEYLKGWLEVARRRTGQSVTIDGKTGVVGNVFYCYTKMIPHFLNLELPKNFRAVASEGGLYDDLIPSSGLRRAVVVLNQEEADAKGLEVDHDDTHVWNYAHDFAIIVHGTQPAGSAASKAVAAARKAGAFAGYGKKKVAA